MVVSIVAVGLGGSTMVVGDSRFMGLCFGWFWNGSQWLKFCGFFFPPMVAAGNGWLLVIGISGWSFVVVVCCLLLLLLFIYLFFNSCRLQLFLLSHGGWSFVVVFRWWGLLVASGGCGVLIGFVVWVCLVVFVYVVVFVRFTIAGCYFFVGSRWLKYCCWFFFFLGGGG